MTKLNAQPGIALAPLLMVIALIAVLVGALGAGANMFGANALNSDRITFELRGQIDQIRAKLDECIMLTRQQAVPQFLYPGFDQLDTALNVADLNCPRDAAGMQNLWQGARPSGLPAHPQNFTDWTYINHGDPDFVSPGGICISIRPVDATTAGNDAVKAAIQAVLKRYSPDEYTYDPNSANQRLIIWIRRPLTGTTC